MRPIRILQVDRGFPTQSINPAQAVLIIEWTVVNLGYVAAETAEPIAEGEMLLCDSPPSDIQQRARRRRRVRVQVARDRIFRNGLHAVPSEQAHTTHHHQQQGDNGYALPSGPSPQSIAQRGHRQGYERLPT